jgi:hypothetical protein
VSHFEEETGRSRSLCWLMALPVVDKGESFTVWYGQQGSVVGVLAHCSDEDYEAGREVVESGAPSPDDAPTTEPCPACLRRRTRPKRGGAYRLLPAGARRARRGIVRYRTRYFSS